ncbi:TPA: phage late control D family protein, partial [Salmonella enterica subsp. enterica serovar Typhimurium var. monophasic 4,[5],12:i:-]|nr:phage late control D family protein [Salmonella enterica subsp. enterica serovar Typhimurium var. monophasic 4,[5],12:i:-]
MAEITVSGGVFATLTPIFTLWYGHKEITYDIAPYVTSISYSDSIKNESDVIAIAL